MGIKLKTSKICSRARTQILVQCHQIFGKIEALRHNSDARCLGFDVHLVSILRGGAACTGITLKTSKIRTTARTQILVQCHQIFGKIEAPSEAGSLGFNVHRAYGFDSCPSRILRGGIASTRITLKTSK
jgi:hypothetical protein